jgi:ADP-ribose pyrophosphatase
MQPAELFRFCPRCAVRRPTDNAGKIPYRCAGCGLAYYFNPTGAAAAWVKDPDGRILLTRRERDPAKGLFGIPGGFVEIGETAEEGLRREVREEVGLEITEIAFLTSCPNLYLYREVTYPVLDLVFTANAIAPTDASPLDGVSGVEWRHPDHIDLEELAFPSMKESIKLLRSSKT